MVHRICCICRCMQRNVASRCNTLPSDLDLPIRGAAVASAAPVLSISRLPEAARDPRCAATATLHTTIAARHGYCSRTSRMRRSATPCPLPGNILESVP